MEAVLARLEAARKEYTRAFQWMTGHPDNELSYIRCRKRLADFIAAWKDANEAMMDKVVPE